MCGAGELEPGSESAAVPASSRGGDPGVRPCPDARQRRSNHFPMSDLPARRKRNMGVWTCQFPAYSGDALHHFTARGRSARYAAMSMTKLTASSHVRNPPRREEMPKIVSIDLQPMAPIEGVTQIQGDITSLTSIQQVTSCALMDPGCEFSARARRCLQLL